MKKIFKTAIFWIIGLLLLLSIMADGIPDIQGAVGNITAIPFLPSIIGTVADFWWVGVLLLVIGVIMGTSGGRKAYARFKRRRRRR